MFKSHNSFYFILEMELGSPFQQRDYFTKKHVKIELPNDENHSSVSKIAFSISECDFKQVRNLLTCTQFINHLKLNP